MSLRKNIRSKVYMNEVFQDYGLEPKARIGRQELTELTDHIQTNYAANVVNIPLTILSNGFFLRAIDNSRGIVFPPVFTFLSGGTEVGAQVVTADGEANGTVYVNTNTGFSFITAAGGRLSYLWNFGDGTTSTEQNPTTKQYSQAGTYSVSVTISNLEGSAVNRKLISNAQVVNYVTVIEPVLDFTWGSYTTGAVHFRIEVESGSYKLQWKVVDIDSNSGLMWGPEGNDSIANWSPARISWAYTDSEANSHSDNNVNVNVTALPQADWTTLATLTTPLEGYSSATINNLSITDGNGSDYIPISGGGVTFNAA
jgi:hypothetical protein